MTPNRRAWTIDRPRHPPPLNRTRHGADDGGDGFEPRRPLREGARADRAGARARHPARRPARADHRGGRRGAVPRARAGSSWPWPAAVPRASRSGLSPIYAVLVRIDFEVGDGVTRPAAARARADAAAAAARGGAAARGRRARRRRPARRCFAATSRRSASSCPSPMPGTRSPPRALVAVTGVPADPGGAALVTAGAVAAMILSDLAVSSFRMCVGLGIDPRASCRAYAWVYLVDACLAPVGLLAALAGRAPPGRRSSPCCRSRGCWRLRPRAARPDRERARAAADRRGGRERLQSIVQQLVGPASSIVDADGTMRTLTGSVEPIFGAAWEHGAGRRRCSTACIPSDAALVRAFLAAVAAKPPASRTRSSGGCATPTARTATSRPWPPTCSTTSASAASCVTARDVEAAQGLRGAAAPPRVPRRADRPRQPRAVLRPHRARAQRAARATTRRSPSCSSTSTTSRPINDARGHADGDALLHEVARRLDRLRCAPATPPRGSAATSSACCSRASPTPRRVRRGRRAHARRAARSRSSSTASTIASRRASAWPSRRR